MINEVIEAVSVSLNEEFGDGYEIHMEEIRQGLAEPCFFITCLLATSRLFRGSKQERTSQFCIQYFPESAEKQRECNAVAERMWRCLEYITLQGADRPIRGTRMKYEVTDGILNFFVNYDTFAYRAEQQISMDTIESSTRVKEGE